MNFVNYCNFNNWRSRQDIFEGIKMSLRAQRGPVRAALRRTLDELKDQLNDEENRDRERIEILFRRSKRHMDKLQDIDEQVSQHLLQNDASEEDFTDEYTAVNLYRDEYDELEQRALTFMKKEVATEQRIRLAKEGLKIQERGSSKKMETIEEIPTATNMLSGQEKVEDWRVFGDKKHESSGCYQAKSRMNEDDQKRVRDNKEYFVCLENEQVSTICEIKPNCPVYQMNDEIKMTHGLSGGTETKENHNVFELRVGNCDNLDSVNLSVLEQTRICRRVSRLSQEVRIEEVKNNSIITTDAGSSRPEIHPLVGAEFAEALVIWEPTQMKDEEVMVEDVIQQSQDSIDVNEDGKYEVAVSSLDCPSSVAENMEIAVRRLVVTMRKLESQKFEDRRHIQGKDSPADLTSRGCNGKQMVESRWWEGPEWCHQPRKKRRHPFEVVDDKIDLMERRKVNGGRMKKL
ncbi:unnamed protein product [Orchesella dallaii]|uniref:Uncharacterized protein n=1 Tax=Orchesella dallaii TaxID=48710 RepID=A0ABP1QUP2_9HEXA